MKAALDPRQAILAQLAGHVPGDAGEADSLARIRALVEGPADPWSRARFQPGHLTASAVVVDPARTRAVLIFHAKLQRWLQPGGHFEAEEQDPLVAAAREVLEETGLETRWPGEDPPLLDVDVHRIPARKQEPEHEHFDLRYLLVAQAGPAVAGDGAEGLRWVEPGECSRLELDPGLLRALRKVPWA